MKETYFRKWILQDPILVQVNINFFTLHCILKIGHKMCKLIYTEFREKIGIQNSTADDCLAYNLKWTSAACGYWRFVIHFFG